MNVEYIVVSPEKVLAAYQAGVDGLMEHWEALEAAAKAVDADYDAETARIVAEERAKEEARRERRRVQREEYDRLNALWLAASPVGRMFMTQPEYPSMTWEFGSHFSMSFYRLGGAQSMARLNAAKAEAESMLEAAEAEPKEFHFTQAQFKRMQDWGSGAVLAGFMPKDTKAEVQHG